MSKIPKCRLETYWANKEVFTCPEFQNVVWKPTGLAKRFFVHVQNSNMSFGNLQGLAKRFLHVQNPRMSFGNLQTRTKRFFKTTLFYGPKAPGAHILLLNIFVYLF